MMLARQMQQRWSLGAQARHRRWPQGMRAASRGRGSRQTGHALLARLLGRWAASSSACGSEQRVVEGGGPRRRAGGRLAGRAGWRAGARIVLLSRSGFAMARGLQGSWASDGEAKNSGYVERKRWSSLA